MRKMCKIPFQCLIVYLTHLINGSAVIIEVNLSMDTDI